MSRSFYARLILNILYSTVIACLVEVFLITNVSMLVDYLEKTGIDKIHAHEMALCREFIEKVDALGTPNIRLVGTRDMSKRGPVVSLDFIGEDNAEISFRLDSEYGISTRCGTHCAPNAHKTLGTYPQGTVRFAFGFANTTEDVDWAVRAIGEILQKS